MKCLSRLKKYNFRCIHTCGLYHLLKALKWVSKHVPLKSQTSQNWAMELQIGFLVSQNMILELYSSWYVDWTTFTVLNNEKLYEFFKQNRSFLASKVDIQTPQTLKWFQLIFHFHVYSGCPEKMHRLYNVISSSISNSTSLNFLQWFTMGWNSVLKDFMWSPQHIQTMQVFEN